MWQWQIPDKWGFRKSSIYIATFDYRIQLGPVECQSAICIHFATGCCVSLCGAVCCWVWTHVKICKPKMPRVWHVPPRTQTERCGIPELKWSLFSFLDATLIYLQLSTNGRCSMATFHDRRVMIPCLPSNKKKFHWSGISMGFPWIILAILSQHSLDALDEWDSKMHCIACRRGFGSMFH